jgi:hypothetical protein
MSYDSRLQLQRFELKYIIKPDVALAVRNFVQSYLKIDEYGATQPNLSYSVHSLYLDSDDLTIYWGTINGNKNRYKLRIRFYENRPKAPVYFEIKRRMNDAILKKRCAIKREAAYLILAGHLPEPDHFMAYEPKQIDAIQDFRYLMVKDKAKPKAHVAYYREAWISPYDNSVRVTLDREVKVDPEPSARFEAEMKNPVVVFGSNVVLELKFTGRFPDWFKELVRLYGLAQCSAAKYADGVALMGEDRLFAGFALPELWQGNSNLQERKDALKRMQSGAMGATFYA